MKVAVLVMLGFVALACGKKVRYDGYKVQRITPQTEEQLQALRNLEGLGVTFWRHPSVVGRPADVMFPPHMQGELFSGIQTIGMKVENYVNNVQELIEATEKKSWKTSKVNAFDEYFNLEDINFFLDEQVAQNPNVASVISIGKTYEGRPLRVLKISRGGAKKPAIWIDANIHAREWITSAVAVYTINELLNGQYQDWTEDFDFYILAMFNPDGFEYTWQKDRLWRKNRSRLQDSLCKGADVNRNFDFHWRDGGSSTNPCSEIFAGKSANSELETQAVVNYIATIPDLVGYISLHSYSQLILLPFGHTNEPIAQYPYYMILGTQIAEAIKKRYDTVYTPGNIVDLLYVSSGGSMDYVKGVFNTNVTLTFEMRDEGKYGFLLPPSQIVPASEEFLDGIQVFVDALRQGVTTPPLDG